jgi:hypothetical protein
MRKRSTFAAAAAAALALPAQAQFGDAWVEFQPDASRISGSVVSNAQNETDLAWGDLDQNGLTDLVVARVQPIMGGGGRTNLLLMNEGGVLVNRTATLAAASDVPGDQGFRTATSDRDIQVADLDGDGWLDVVTAVGFGEPTDPKHISHPRVYVNLGLDDQGNWLGLRHEDARIPQLFNFLSGNPSYGRFNAVAVGDVDGDGDLDLYFGDHDGSPSSPFGGESPTLDTDDRLLLNDGNGFFTDGTQSLLTQTIISSNFCNSAVIADFDLDGRNDILKQTNSSPRVEVSYGAPIAPFAGPQFVTGGSPYNISAGDLNDDGRLDIVVSDNGNDAVIYNTGTDASGQVTWSPRIPFDFLAGGDDGFASNSLAADLDGDGRQDVLIADVDPQVSGFNRRLHVYHNRGNLPTGAALLREERETAGAGWVGFVGATASDLQGTHDVAVFDVDGDGLDDLIISRNAGTLVWIRQPVCQTDLGFGTPGLDLSVCGNALTEGAEATIALTGAAPGATVLLAASTQSVPVFIPILQATVVTVPPVLLEPFTADAAGELSIPIEGVDFVATLVVQCLVANGLPTLFSPSNAVQVEFLGN